jgi:hypothetical protein
MTSTSAGSQPNGKEFLNQFVRGERLAQRKEEEIRKLQDERIPPTGAQALAGQLPYLQIKDMANSGVLKV